MRRLNERLDRYYDKEASILEGGVQSYGIGSRNISRYNADLSAVRDAIDDLEGQIDELCAKCCGRGTRRAVATVIRDW